jgi:hypothetical protein
MLVVWKGGKTFKKLAKNKFFGFEVAPKES